MKYPVTITSIFLVMLALILSPMMIGEAFAEKQGPHGDIHKEKAQSLLEKRKTIHGDSYVLPPRHQMHLIEDNTEIMCKEGHVLMIRASGNPVCLSPPSYLRSIDRGWGNFDADLMGKNPVGTKYLIGYIMQHPQLRAEIIERISNDPEKLEEIKSNENLMSMLEGKGMIDTGVKLESGKAGIMSDMLGKTFDFANTPMMRNMADMMIKDDGMKAEFFGALDDSPSMVAQMRASEDLMGKLFGS